MDKGFHFVEREVAGRTLRIETGKLAKQAAGAVVVSYGETVVLSAVVAAAPREGIDFFPLTVDYREKTYAAGKFPGGFFKRESRPTNKEILTMRMTDRPLRPLFPEGYRDEVLIQSMVLAMDQENDPDLLSVIGASAALMISSIPFQVPVAACRIGYIDEALVVNPTIEQLDYSRMEMVVAGHKEAANMIEVGATEISEEIVAEGIRLAHKTIIDIASAIDELAQKAGNPKTWTPPEFQGNLLEELRSKYRDKLRDAKLIMGKQNRNKAVDEVYNAAKAEYCPEGEAEPVHSWSSLRDLLDKVEGEVVAEMTVEKGIRPDGRSLEGIRPLLCEVAVLPCVHGSALFQRGETQALGVVTLGTGRDEQIVDGLTEEYSKKFMLHYNFPPLCTGEVKRVGATSRREIGHGNLAEKALQYVLPTPEDFPYTTRLVSEILESNGSSSMASVCAGCLALMDAGVPIRQPVAGISIGMMDWKGKRKLIVDILGEEDHFGEMDFKVAGTQLGITAVQLDLKARGLSHDLIVETLKVAREARLKILREMLQTLRAPRETISKTAPRILTTKVAIDKIGKVIGPGGKGIKAIESETGAKVEINDDGTIIISCLEMSGAERALELVEAVTAEIKVGKIYSGRVSNIKEFGAFIEVAPGVDGLCHISELDAGFVKSVEDVIRVGDEVRVKVIAVDDQGRVKLSRKAVMLEEQEQEAAVK